MLVPRGSRLPYFEWSEKSMNLDERDGSIICPVVRKDWPVCTTLLNTYDINEKVELWSYMKTILL
jgi:hypothetical protein